MAQTLTMVIFQAVEMESVYALTIFDIDLVNGILNVPRLKKSNERSLRIEYKQATILKAYINEIRPLFLKKNKAITDKVFMSEYGCKHLHNVGVSLCKRVKAICPDVIRVSHIRSSVLSHWGNEMKDDVPRMMYKAGHRYLGATESYLNSDTTTLGEKVQKYFGIKF